MGRLHTRWLEKLCRNREDATGPPPGFRTVVLVVVLCVALTGATVRPATAQEEFGPIQTEVSIFGAGASTDQFPFWLDANEFGRFDRSGGNLGTRLAVRRPFSEETDGFDYALGVDLLARASDNSTIHAQELYGQLRYGKLQFTAGWKKRTIGRVDTARSLGGTTLSGNATPLPKLSVSTTGYVSVPGTQDFLGFNAYMAHGWMPEDRVISSPFLHEKYGYLRILPPAFPVTLHVGLVHHAFWGGDLPEFLSSGVDVEGAFDSDPKQFARVLVGVRRKKSSDVLEIGPDHIGNWDFGADVDIGPVQGRIYRQFFFEDVNGFRFRNVWDGLWGASLRRAGGPALLDAVLYEHFRLIRQGAKRSAGEPAGANRAFSHSFFRSGWTHQSRTLSLPLVTPPANTPGFPDNRFGIANSLVIAHHVALEGTVAPSLSYRLTGTYSENSGAQGVCGNPECSSVIDRRFSRTSQWSFLVETFGAIPGTKQLSYELGVAVDTGDFRDESVGVRFGLTWQGLYASGRR